MRLYIIRHADPDYPNNTITEAGHAEAEALARRLEREGITRIYSSPMGRALDTMRYTAQRLGIEPGVEPWMRELMELRMPDGPCEGFMTWDLHGEIIRSDPHHARSMPWHCLPPMDKAEYREAVERVNRHSDALLGSLGYHRDNGRYRVEQTSTDRVAVFCHNGLALTWLSHLLEIPLALIWSGFWLAPSAVTVVLFDQRSEQWAVPRCLCVGDTSHLYATGLAVRPRGIKGNFD
jgi:probable phosphoglycerate mutase